MIPAPKKVQIGDNMVHCSVFDSGVQLTMDKDMARKRVRDGFFILPPVFVAKCKDLIQKHTDQIRSWFNPAPSASTIASVTHLPETIPCESRAFENAKEITLRVSGIIVESHRILPHITLDFVRDMNPPNLMDSLTIPENEIEEVTDDIIVQDLEDDDDEDDYDDDDEDDYDDEDDDDDRFARVQRSLDEAREELERLRRERNRG